MVGDGDRQRSHRQRDINAEDWREIHDGFRHLLELFESRVQQVDGRESQLRADLVGLDKLIRGNGTEGLLSKINTFLEREKYLSQRVDNLERSWNKMIWGILSVLVTCVGTLILVIFKK